MLVCARRKKKHKFNKPKQDVFVFCFFARACMCTKMLKEANIEVISWAESKKRPRGEAAPDFHLLGRVVVSTG